MRSTPLSSSSPERDGNARRSGNRSSTWPRCSRSTASSRIRRATSASGSPMRSRSRSSPPTSEHVEAVVRLLPPAYRLPLLWLDWSGARVASVETVSVGDYDELARRVRLRASTTKTRAALWVELPDALAEAIEVTLPPRDDRDGAVPLFAGVSADRLGTTIARACRAAGVPLFSPHDLRHRRISLLHRQGRTWAEIGRLVGQRKLSVTADTYTHVLSDGRELDYATLLSEAVRR